VGEAGESDAGEGERSDGEEPERHGEIGSHGRRRMGAAVMRCRRRARGRRWHRWRLQRNAPRSSAEFGSSAMCR
jgi:hypothetical protein